MQAKFIILSFYLDYPILNCLAYIKQVKYLKKELFIKNALNTLVKYVKNFQEFNLIFKNLSLGVEGFNLVYFYNNNDNTKIKLQAIKDFNTELLKKINAQILDFIGQIYPSLL